MVSLSLQKMKLSELIANSRLSLCWIQILSLALLLGAPEAFQSISDPMRFVAIPATRFLRHGLSRRSDHYFHVLSSQAFSTSGSNSIPSNEELVRNRLQVAKEKREAREHSVQETTQRNLHIKRLIQSKEKNDNNFLVPALYALKVSVCDDLRKELNLSGRERRGRVFVETGSPATRSLKALKYDIHAFFRALRKSSFVLSASLPEVDSDGSLNVQKNLTETNTWTVETDDDVAKTFEIANNFFENSDSLKRPSLILHLAKDPNAPPPPPPPAYLENMADPKQSPTITMLSFYSFPPSGISDPEEFALSLRKQWKPFHALGRVYVANEGVNAQMSVPTNVLRNFIECCRGIPELGDYMENGINIDPVPLTQEEFAAAGVPVNGEPSPPFRNLHVRVRNQIVADGLSKPLNWQSAGYDMPPLEWHEKLKEAKRKREEGVTQDLPVVFDCRNTYETDVGIFEGAEPLNTENFRESWDVLSKRLENVPKDSPIMTYCTGGIRCVKVGAYLTQELGFTNVSRLAGGVIAYDRTVKEKASGEDPMFRGTNFVFDGRLGRKITDDKLGACITCGGETSLVSNCLNDNCHKRMVQCETCRTSFHGTCSEACKLRLVKNGAMTPRRTEMSLSDAADAQVDQRALQTIDEYSMAHSTPPPSLFKEIELNTQAFLPSGSHMVSGAEQGRLLKQLASMTREGRVLELGTFTGYATACFLEGVTKVAPLLNDCAVGTRERGPYVLSMERDQRAFNLAAAHMKIMAEYGVGEAGAQGACALRASDSVESIQDPDGSLLSVVYDNAASCDLLKVSDALASLDAMAAGKSVGVEQPAPFDLVFLDADKTRLIDYVETCLDGDRILKKGGLIVVDNVLWKGLVLQAAGAKAALIDKEDADEAEIKKNRRARKLASKMHRFNDAIVKDPRVEVLVLQIRDGLSIIRKK